MLCYCIITDKVKRRMICKLKIKLSAQNVTIMNAAK